jgi:hypothetical protein
MTPRGRSIPGKVRLDEFEMSHLAIHVCERTWHWRPQPFVDFDLWVVFEGAGVLTVNGIEYPLGSGTGFCFNREIPWRKARSRRFACRAGLPSETGRFLKTSARRQAQQGGSAFKTEEVDPFRRRAEEAIRWDQERGVKGVFEKLLVEEMVLRVLLLCGGRPILSKPTVLSRLASQRR